MSGGPSQPPVPLGSGDTGPENQPSQAEQDAVIGAPIPEGDPAAAEVPRIPPLSFEEQVAATASNTTQAKAEEKSLSSYLTADEIGQRARQAEADRHQRFKDAFEVVAIDALHLGAVVLGILASVWALHLILPSKARWLSAEDLTHIQTLLTAGVLVGVVGGHFKKRLADDSDSK